MSDLPLASVLLPPPPTPDLKLVRTVHHMSFRRRYAQLGSVRIWFFWHFRFRLGHEVVYINDPLCIRRRQSTSELRDPSIAFNPRVVDGDFVLVSD